MRETDVDVPPPDREWLWEFAQELQKSLRVDELVRVFSEHTDSVIHHDGVEFQDEAGNEPVCIGTPSEHRCAYKIRLPEESLGTIRLTRDTPFSPGETTAIENIVLNLAYPLRNALLYERVLKVAAEDTLTGLGNRASLDTTLEREIASANRHREPLSVIMVDVDHFKGINDAHGHVAGDEVLRSLAGCIADCIRDSDVAFRFGGEEFVIILSKTGLDGARRLAERVRGRVEDLEIRIPETELRVTASLGIAVMGPDDAGGRFLEKADAAMYQSKEAGRNRVSCFEDDGLAAPADVAPRRPASSARS